MHTNPTTPPQPSLAELVREMRERNAERRERVLSNIAKLHEIAAARRERGRRLAVARTRRSTSKDDSPGSTAGRRTEGSRDIEGADRPRGS